MRLSDRVTGLFLVGLGAAAAYGGWRLPPVPGQPVGPNIFPLVIGIGLAICGLAIASGIGRSFEEEEEIIPFDSGEAPAPTGRLYALLVPVTFYLSPLAAIATIVAASSMAIFSGDIPGALLRIPGTPASAAYADEAYAMTRKGEAELALGAGVWFSAVGGIAGTLSLMILAPPLAEIALSFSTFEYFWLAFLGLMCATLVARSSPVKAIAGMFIGLLVSCIGIENPGGVPRFTFGMTDLFGGIEPIPALVGVFAVAQVMRAMLTPEPPPIPRRKFGSIMAGQWLLTKKYIWQMSSCKLKGIIIGVLPGAGADMAAWVSYAMSKKFSKTPEKFGTGHVEGLVEAGASNNASIASGWVPSLLFGIPGDTIAAIAIGVLYMKGLNPGPTLFTEKRRACTPSI